MSWANRCSVALRAWRRSAPNCSLAQLQHSARLNVIAWEEVQAITAEAFVRPAPERLASYTWGRSSNEAASLLLRAIDSNNLADCSDLFHALPTTGLRQAFGSSTSNVNLKGLRQADCVVLIGSNTPANHLRLVRELVRLRERGGTVILINPTLEVGLLKFGSPAFPIRSLLQGTEIASIFLQPIPGSDTAVLVGIQKTLLERPHRLGAVARPVRDHHQRGGDRQHRRAQWSHRLPRGRHDADLGPLERAGLRLDGGHRAPA